MKCAMCGRIVRVDHGQMVRHECPPRKAPKRRRVVREASREEQHGRYLDCGPGAWDDR